MIIINKFPELTIFGNQIESIGLFTYSLSVYIGYCDVPNEFSFDICFSVKREKVVIKGNFRLLKSDFILYEKLKVYKVVIITDGIDLPNLFFQQNKLILSNGNNFSNNSFIKNVVQLDRDIVNPFIHLNRVSIRHDEFVFIGNAIDDSLIILNKFNVVFSRLGDMCSPSKTLSISSVINKDGKVVDFLDRGIPQAIIVSGLDSLFFSKEFDFSYLFFGQLIENYKIELIDQ